MAVNTRTIPGNLATVRTSDTSAAATAQTASSATAKLLGAWVDNTANSAASYIKLYNNASPTVGTTAPDVILYVPGSTAMQFNFPVGTTFGTAVSYACVTTGGTGGAASPASAVKFDLLLG